MTLEEFFVNEFRTDLNVLVLSVVTTEHTY